MQGLSLGIAACGASTSASPARAADSEDASEESGSDEGVDASMLPASEESSPEPVCEDETCFVCGSGLCPKGFYCDEDARGGAACAWLPDCAKAPSCECVIEALGSACQCDEKDSGLFVSCSGQ